MLLRRRRSRCYRGRGRACRAVGRARPGGDGLRGRRSSRRGTRRRASGSRTAGYSTSGRGTSRRSTSRRGTCRRRTARSCCSCCTACSTRTSSRACGCRACGCRASGCRGCRRSDSGGGPAGIHRRGLVGVTAAGRSGCRSRGRGGGRRGVLGPRTGTLGAVGPWHVLGRTVEREDSRRVAAPRRRGRLARRRRELLHDGLQHRYRVGTVQLRRDRHARGDRLARGRGPTRRLGSARRRPTRRLRPARRRPTRRRGSARRSGRRLAWRSPLSLGLPLGDRLARGLRPARRRSPGRGRRRGSTPGRCRGGRRARAAGRRVGVGRGATGGALGGGVYCGRHDGRARVLGDLGLLRRGHGLGFLWGSGGRLSGRGAGRYWGLRCTGSCRAYRGLRCLSRHAARARLGQAGRCRRDRLRPGVLV